MTKLRTLLFSILQIMTIWVIGQNSANPIDTIAIFKNKSGVGFKIYEYNWNLKFGHWSYKPKKMTKQDSTVLFDKSSRYYKVYRRNGSLKFAGLRDGYFETFIGNVIYFRNNGSVIKQEQWNSGGCIDTLGQLNCLGDGPTIIKTCYYDKRSRLRKQSFYLIRKLQSKDNEVLMQTDFFKKDGKLKATKLKKIM